MKWFIFAASDPPVSPPRTNHWHHDIHDTYICQYIWLPERKCVKSPTLLRLKRRFLSQWNPGKFGPKFQQTRSPMYYNIWIILFAASLSLRRPRGATRPTSVSCFCFLFRKGHHCGNKLFPVSVSVILTERPIAVNLYGHNENWCFTYIGLYTLIGSYMSAFMYAPGHHWPNMSKTLPLDLREGTGAVL